jgi:hypothetical protein
VRSAVSMIAPHCVRVDEIYSETEWPEARVD